MIEVFLRPLRRLGWRLGQSAGFAMTAVTASSVPMAAQAAAPPSVSLRDVTASHDTALTGKRPPAIVEVAPPIAPQVAPQVAEWRRTLAAALEELEARTAAPAPASAAPIQPRIVAPAEARGAAVSRHPTSLPDPITSRAFSIAAHRPRAVNRPLRRPIRPKTVAARRVVWLGRRYG